MIGAFPRGGAWVTVQLAAGSDETQHTLLELFGECPSDPDARIIRATTCEGADDALAQAAARLRSGWAEHATGDAPADEQDTAAALHSPPWTPAVAAGDTALAPDVASAAVVHALCAASTPFCLIPNPTAGRRASRDGR
jgi:hypothetical protein